jgi:nuclear pore complex protein Nup155
VFEEKSNSSATAGNARVGAGDDPETVRSHAFELAFLSKDEMFHSTLYEWLINRSLADELLEVWPSICPIL